MIKLRLLARVMNKMKLICLLIVTGVCMGYQNRDECSFEEMVLPISEIKKPFGKLFAVGTIKKDFKKLPNTEEIIKIQKCPFKVNFSSYGLQQQSLFKIGNYSVDNKLYSVLEFNRQRVLLQNLKNSSIDFIGYNRSGPHTFLYFSLSASGCSNKIFSLLIGNKSVELTLFDNNSVYDEGSRTVIE